MPVIGSRLLHYEITAHVGSGGMGDVYRATDTKLGREVAIKLLPAELSEDTERVARFEREARTLASFHHTNIAAIYGFEQDAGRRFLVMELVEGEDFQARLKRGALSIEDTLDTAKQIAEGLEAAHEQNIVHRDLKPANVVRGSDGTVKILDFGLARAYTPDDVELDIENSPTITAAMTQAGVILGTAAYMSPEQARGKNVDKRADIWSFGVILMEMLTSRRLFDGETISDTMAGVLKSEIDLDSLPPGTPANLRSLLARCLDRNPKTRLRDIGEARVLLNATPGPDTVDASAVRGASRLPWLFAGLALGAVISIFAARALSPTADQATVESVRFEIPVPNPPDNLHCAFDPDGKRLIFNDAEQLYLRHLDDPEARPIPNTEGSIHCTWSPDGQWIAFNVGVNVYKIQPDGSRRFLVCQVVDPLHPSAGSVSWLMDDHLLLVQGDGGLLKVSAMGGNAESYLEPGPEELDFHSASELPGGAGILFAPHSEGFMNSVDLVDSDGRTKILTHSPNSNISNPTYSAGHMLFSAAGENAGIWAIPYSIPARATTGDPVLLLPEGNYVATSLREHLAYTERRAESDSDLILVDRSGATQQTVISKQAGLVPQASLSPDGKQLAVTIRSNDEDIWVYEVADGSRRRVIFGEGRQLQPAWTPDGKQLAYARGGGFERRPFLRDLNLATDAGISELSGQDFSFSADQSFVAFSFQTAQLDWNVGFANLLTGESQALTETLASERMPALSPDGKYIAYQSDESGRTEIYLQPFPDGNGRWRVSEDGGEEPFWSADETALYFRARTDLMEVKLTTSPGLVLGEARKVFTRARMNWVGRGGDGDLFLVHEPSESAETETTLIVWTNWAANRK
jgi:serine/threonine-protein kinase